MTILAQCGQPILLGHVGENDVTAVIFDRSAWLTEYGEGAFALVVRRPGEDVGLPVEITADGGIVTWNVTAYDTQRRGGGEAQLIFSPTGRTKKTEIFRTYVSPSLTSPEDPPESWRGWIDDIIATAATAQNAAAEAEGSAAEAASSEADAAEAAEGAAASQSAAALSEAAAAASASSAAASEAAAAASEESAAQSATDAAGSQTAAASSEAAAAASEAAAEQSAADAASSAGAAYSSAFSAASSEAAAAALEEAAAQSAESAAASQSAAASSESAAASSETAAASSQAAAASSATAAASSATAAAASASSASSSKTAAAGSASAAAQSATAAAASETNAAASAAAAAQSAATLVIDPTLSSPTQAAQAKATGDAINETREMIAGREASTTATKNYSVGDLLVCSDKLYRVTAAIATGETIAEGTNVTPDTVAAELSALEADKADKAEAEVLAQIADRIYQGVDLTVKFADEIGSDPWAWIRSRIRAGNFTGIHLNDYIPFTTTNNVSLKACVGGINTYKDYGDTVVGNHIDFICRELWQTRHPINPVNYNNGLIPVETLTGDGTTTTFVLTKEMDGIASVTQGGEGLTGYSYDASTYTLTFAEAPAAGTITVTGTGTEHPWLASDLYHWLNSLSGQVPNGTGLNPAVKHVDYTQGGVYYYLPAKLKNVIVEKRAYLPKRYSASGLLSDDNAGAWADIGKLWLPSEFEVYGAPVWSGKGGYATMGNCVQYPIFAHNMNRVKNRGGSRDNWWVLSVNSGNTASWCHVNASGYANNLGTSYSNVAVPVCFRVS